MSQLLDKTGICCDRCGLVIRDDFTYFSFDLRRTQLCDGRRPGIDNILRLSPDKSFDLCELCVDQMKQLVITNYRPVKAGMRCDFCGKQQGSGHYFHAELSRVAVVATGQPYVCAKCRIQRADAEKPCSCGSLAFVRPAASRTTRRLLELDLDEGCASGFQSRPPTCYTTRT